MTEMHSFLLAKQVEILPADSQAQPLAQDLYDFLFQMCEWIQASPSIHPSEYSQGNAVYVCFNDVAFDEEDFWQMFGCCLSLLCNRWKIEIFGTAPLAQESVCLTLQQQSGHIYAVQKTLSGRPVQTIRSLYLRIGCSEDEEAELLRLLFASTNWENGSAALDWKYSAFSEREKIALSTQNSCFCYASASEDEKPEALLQTLSFPQKVLLWSSFLRQGVDYTEFEWLYHAICEDMVDNRTEWEFSLYMAMRQLNYSIKASPNDFELYDGQRNRRYFSFNSTRYAERAFLKMLFPLNL